MTLISSLSEHFIQKVKEERNRNSEFNQYFPDADNFTNVLSPYFIKITGDNYKDKAEGFLSGYTDYKSAIDGINQIMDFIQTKLDKVERFK